MLNTLEQLQKLNHWGYFKHPKHPELWNITQDDLPNLDFNHRYAKTALAEFQAFDSHFDDLAQLIHHRDIQPDGVMGPVSESMFETQRCDVPDWGPGSGLHPWEGEDVEMAIGNGNWSRCHGASDHHKAVAWIAARLSSHLAAPYQGERVIDAVLLGVRNLYGEMGLEWVWDWNQSTRGHQTVLEINRWPNSWLGLASVPQVGRSCSASPLFARHQNYFRSGSSAATVIAWWIILIGHELGHNCGLGHSRGGIMNPTINLVTPATWKGDAFERIVRAMFSGNPVPGYPFGAGNDFEDDGFGANTVWNWTHRLTGASGASRDYAMRMEGPMLPGGVEGPFHGNFGKDGEPIPLHWLCQPGVRRTSDGQPLEVVA